MLCHICSSIDFSQASKKMNFKQYMEKSATSRAAYGYPHHTSYSALLKAANDNCQLCKAISTLAVDRKWIDGETQLYMRIGRVGDSLGLRLLDGQEQLIAELGVYALQGKQSS